MLDQESRGGLHAEPSREDRFERGNNRLDAVMPPAVTSLQDSGRFVHLQHAIDIAA